VPFPAEVRALAEAGVVPGGTKRNLAWVTAVLDDGGYDEVDCLLLADAQTSGGLLFGATPERAARRAATSSPRTPARRPGSRSPWSPSRRMTAPPCPPPSATAPRWPPTCTRAAC